MGSYTLEVKVRLTIPLHAESYTDAVDQVKYWLIKEDIVSDFDIINVDAHCEEEDHDT